MSRTLTNESYGRQLRQGLWRALGFNLVLSGALFLCLLTPAPPYAVGGVFGFFVGAVIGDFLNHLYYRLANGIHIVGPANHCPHCLVVIKSIHNVPIFGWLMVRGRCTSCGVAIPIRYLLAGVCGGGILSGLFLFTLSQLNSA